MISVLCCWMCVCVCVLHVGTYVCYVVRQGEHAAAKCDSWIIGNWDNVKDLSDWEGTPCLLNNVTALHMVKVKPLHLQNHKKYLKCNLIKKQPRTNYSTCPLTCTSQALGHSFCRKSAALYQERAHLDVSGWTPAPPWCRLSWHPLLTHLEASYSHISAQCSCFSTSRQPTDSQVWCGLYFGREDHLILAGQQTHPERSWLPAKRKGPISQEVSCLPRSCSAGTFSPRNPGFSWLRCDKKLYCNINMYRTETRWL